MSGTASSALPSSMEETLSVCQINTDYKFLLSNLNHAEDQLQLNRRWLMGLSLSKNLPEYRSLPESFLREDDEFCSRVKRHVEKRYRKDLPSAGRRDGGSHLVEDAILRRVLSTSSTLSSFTNEGLYQISSLLTKGSVNFPRTRKKMMRLIMNSLPSSFDVDLVYELSVLINNPNHIQGDALSSVLPAFTPRGSAMRILGSLDEMPAEVLLAIYKKLNQTPTRKLQLEQKKIGLSKDFLIKKVRNIVQDRISEYGMYDELPVSVTKALAIAHLSCPGLPDFNMFSSATKRLQMELKKAIFLVKKKVRMPEMKALQGLLDPNSNVSNGRLRTSLRKLLTSYLYECSEMDTVPEFLSEALDLINRSSRSLPYGMLVDEEIASDCDCILNLSAQSKQIVWNLLPNYELDEDFSDAYMEELEDSDEHDSEDEAQTLFDEHCDDFPEISVGENITPDHHPPSISHPPVSFLKTLPLVKTNCEHLHEQSLNQNVYLRVQNACDETSMAAYNLIGRMIQNFSQADGIVLGKGDFAYLTGYCSDQEHKDLNSSEEMVIQAVKDSFSALSNSTVDKLKKLLGV